MGSAMSKDRILLLTEFGSGLGGVEQYLAVSPAS